MATSAKEPEMIASLFLHPTAFVKMIEENVKDLVHPGNPRVTQFDNALSDHMPVVADVPGVASLVSWNIWNPAHKRHITNTDTNPDNQRLAHAWFVQDSNAKEREECLIKNIKKAVEMQNIVCLQEVWPEFKDQLVQSFTELAVVHATCISKENDDMNVIVIPFKYTILGKQEFLAPPAWKRMTHAYTIWNNETSKQFTVLNLHMPFKRATAMFADVLKAAAANPSVWACPFFICGDLNISSRADKPKDGEHLSIIQDILPSARIAHPLPPYYTHCGHVANGANGVMSQLDAFDYIIWANHTPDNAA